MKLSRINLNLLVVLDVLLEEKHVTKASKKLHVTQSTVSASLSQLRDLFEDELLVRESNRMVLTPKAQQLAPKVREVLQQLQSNIFSDEEFNAETTERTFTLAMSDYLECLLLPDLNAYLTEHAPNIKIRIKHIEDMYAVPFDDASQVDLGLTMLESKAKNVSSEELFSDRFVCAGGGKNPLLQEPLSLKKYLEAEHLSLSRVQSEQLEITDQALKAQGLNRHIKLTTSYISTALYLLASSDLITTAPLNLVKKAQTLLDLSYQELPFELPTISIYQVWPGQFDNAPAHQWLHNIVKTTLLNRLKEF